MKKFKNIKRTSIAIILGFGLITNMSYKTSFADELSDVVISEINDKAILKEELENYDIASSDELSLFDNDKTDINLLEFGKDYNERLNLSILLKELSKIPDIKDIIDMDHYYMILNDVNLGYEDIINENNNLAEIISLNKIEIETLLTNEEIEELQNEAFNYIYKGILFENDEDHKEDHKIDQNDMTLLYNAVIKSRDYYEADDNIKLIYEDELSKIDDILDQKTDDIDYDKAYVNLLEFAKTDDKINFTKEIKDKIDEDISKKEDHNNEEMITDTKIIDNNSLYSSNEKIEFDSPFYKNEATRDAYLALTDLQRKELDQMNTNNDDVLSDEEINNSDNYETPIPTDMWLYPFTKEVTTNPTAEIDNAGQEEPKETNNENQESTKIPNTVTISETPQKTEDKTTPKTETPAVKTVDKPKANTVSKENVKTGVDSIGIVVAVLAVAILGFLLTKNKDKKNKK